MSEGRAPQRLGGVRSLPAREAPRRSAWRRDAVVAGLLLLAVGLAFGRAAGHDFVNFDDNVYVYDNPRVAAGLTADGIVWAFTGRHAANWHPLTWLSHMLDVQLFGLRPAGHHASSVLLHGLTAAFLFLALRSLTGRLWTSAFAAALFALHPMRAESVAWVAERKDVLSGLFFALALGAYARYARRPSSLPRYLAVVALFALGLMAKPMLVTLPLLLLVLDCWPLGRGCPARRSAPDRPGAHPRRWGRLALEKVPLLLLSAASAAVTLWAQREAIVSDELLSPGWRVANAAVSYVEYLGKSLFPANLAVFYPHPGSGLAAWKAATAGGTLVAVTAGTLAVRRRHPWLAAGWLWFLGMLVPVIGLVQTGGQATADRYAYLPQIGLAVALAWTTAAAGGTARRRPMACGAAAAALALLALGAWRQTGHWRDSETLFTRALAVTPGNALAHNNLGVFLSTKGRTDEAIAQYRRALELWPRYAEAATNLGVALAGRGLLREAMGSYRDALSSDPGHAGARYNLGNALALLGRDDEAIREYERALAVDPGMTEARVNLCAALERRGRPEEAAAQCRAALADKPDSSEAHANLGAALAALGRFDEAVRQHEAALRLAPASAEARFNLGNALFACGRTGEAIAAYRAALAVRPDYAEAHANLGGALLQRGSLEEAVASYRRALEIAPDTLEAHANLAAILERQGRRDEADAHLRRALALAEQRGDPQLAGLLRSRLAGREPRR